MAFLPIYRLVTFGVTLFFSLIAVALAAHLTFTTVTFGGVYIISVAMCIAVASLSIITLPIMFGIDLVRKGAFTSMVVVELVWLSILWVLWLVGAALTAQDDVLSGNLTSQCGDVLLTPAEQNSCREFASIEAFSFLNWLILLAYTSTLLAYALIGASRGHSVWTGSVSTTQFLAPRQGVEHSVPAVGQEKSYTVASTPVSQYQQYPIQGQIPQQQVQYSPQVPQQQLQYSPR